jgi:GAF domain-containing protein
VTTVSVERLAKIFVEIADTLVDEFDLIDFLHTLTERAASLINASAVGLLLADERGRLEFMAASTESAKLVELLQLQAQEGPCLEAFGTGEVVNNVDLAGATSRWPTFATHALEAGFRSVHAFPLRLRVQRIGVLNVFGQNTGGDFEAGDIAIMQALADVAAIGLLQERTIHRSEMLTEQLQGALNSRIVIEQAKGAMAQARGIGVDEAFALIRDFARARNRRLTDVANAILADPNNAARLR